MNVHIALPTREEIIARDARLHKRPVRSPSPVARKRPRFVWVRPDCDQHVLAWRAWLAAQELASAPLEFVTASAFLEGLTYEQLCSKGGNRGVIDFKHSLIRKTNERYPHLSSTDLGKLFHRNHTHILYCLGRLATGKSGHSQKLSDDDVRDIRARAATGKERLKDIAKEYGVAPPTVSAIVSGKKRCAVSEAAE